jgi:hypothetical protein
MQNDKIKLTVAILTIFLAMIACNTPFSQDDAAQNQAQIAQSIPTNTLPQFPTNTLPKVLTPTTAPLPTNTATATVAPTSTTAPTPTIKNHYYFNNFDSETQGELFSSHDQIKPRFANGQLALEVTSTSNLLYHLTMYEKDIIDAHINAQVFFEGSQFSGVGLFCRLTENELGGSFYSFVLDKSGNFVIQYRTPTEDGNSKPEETLAQGKTDLLDQPNRPMNQIQAVCQGEDLYFFLNGRMLAEVTTDRPITAGKYGLLVWYDDRGEVITTWWDMVTITTP